ncbi:MAG: PD40 domain-containing protein, partial [Calditrichaeota bacterium]|nr:PD40 domain-containing protein [Calditrichota bacterium]
MGKIFVITLFLLSLPGLAQQRPLSFTDMFEMGRVSDPQISPDGRWVAYGITYYNVAENNRNADLYLVSTDGKVHKQLTFHPATDASPLWSADSKQLAFI